MPLTIRPATHTDIPAIAGIYGQSVLTGTASFELTPPGETEMARRMDEIAGKGFPYLAGEIDGVFAGYAYAGFYRTRPGYRFTVEDSIYIDPAFHRRGVGKALLTALIEICEAKGYRQMMAVIGDSPNQAGSIAVHKAAGFVRVGLLPDVGFKFGRWVDTLLMQRVLGQGAATDPGQ